jgi:predicted metal-dependent enzyme (double-stranded beta helix superfamily)
MLPVEEFAKLLTTIPEVKFHRQGVLDFMRGHKVDSASLAPYLYYCHEHYTRNLIHKTALFELIAICWEVGQKSPIHNHCNQECWMAAPIGKVQIHNFKLIHKDAATSFCELEPSRHFIIDSDSPNEVDPGEPIHLVANPSSFGARAVTLHVYSKPYDTCEVYDMTTNHYEVVKLVNTTEYGVLKQTGMKVEKVAV